MPESNVSKQTVPTAQDLYERYERSRSRSGCTVQSWSELSSNEKEAWEAVQRFVYTMMNPL